MRMSVVGVTDFETTGLSPAIGDGATEIAIVLVEDEHRAVVADFDLGAEVPGYPVGGGEHPMRRIQAKAGQ